MKKEFYLTKFFSGNNIRNTSAIVNWFRRTYKIVNHKTKEYKTWQSLQEVDNNYQFKEPVKVTILIHPHDRRERDYDNIWKPVLDLLVNRGVLIDDSNKYIKEHHDKEWNKPFGDKHIKVIIEPYIEDFNE